MTAHKPQTIDEYLAPLSSDMPAFRLNGKMLVSFGAAANHCAFYPGAHPVRTYEDELASYDTSKGTVRFQPDRPLPAALVRKLVKTRIAQYTAGEER